MSNLEMGNTEIFSVTVEPIREQDQETVENQVELLEEGDTIRSDQDTFLRRPTRVGTDFQKKLEKSEGMLKNSTGRSTTSSVILRRQQNGSNTTRYDSVQEKIGQQ